jgi:hypothetical protein
VDLGGDGSKNEIFYFSADKDKIFVPKRRSFFAKSQTILKMDSPQIPRDQDI